MSLEHESLGHDGDERLSSRPVGSATRPKPGDNHQLLQLQRLAGNRALTALIGGPAVLQRDKRKDFAGSRTHDRRQASARIAAQRLRGQTLSPAAAAKALREVLYNVWDTFAYLGMAEANGQCEVAADAVSHRLRSLGIAHGWFGVVWWPPDDDRSGSASARGLDDSSDEPDTAMNHYAIIAHNVVIDVTGQQFPGGRADITPYTPWFVELQSRIPRTTPAKYGLGDARGAGAKNLAGAYGFAPYAQARGLPLHS